MGALQADLEQIHDIGPVAAETIYRFMRQAHNRKLIERLRKAGVKMLAEGPPPERLEQIFAGQTVVVTGTLKAWTREEAKALIEVRGGKISSSVSKKTAFILAGADPGSKLAKARELNLRVVDESTFRTMLL